MNFINFLGDIDTSLILYGILFIAIMAVVKFVLNRSIFKGQKGVSTIVAIIISILSIYGLATTNFSFDIFFFNLGISEEIISFIVPWILLIMAFFIIVKWGFGPLFMIFGALFLIAGLTKIVYESEMSMTIGFWLIILGLIIFKKERKRRKTKRELKGLNIKDREEAKAMIKSRKANERTKWRERGRKAGYAYASRMHKIRTGFDRRAAKKDRRREERRIEEDNRKKIERRGEIMEKRKQRLVMKRQRGIDHRRADEERRVKDEKLRMEKERIKKVLEQERKDLEEKKKTRRNKRSQKELQEKYDEYSSKIQKIMKKNGRTIPDLESKEGKKYHRYVQAMRAIENLAEEKNFKLK